MLAYMYEHSLYQLAMCSEQALGVKTTAKFLCVDNNGGAVMKV